MFTVTRRRIHYARDRERNVTVTHVTVTSMANGGRCPGGVADTGAVSCCHRTTSVPPRRLRKAPMADFLHDLPLSWRPRRDESDVTGDWRDAVAEVIDVAATQLDAAEVGETTREWLATDFLRAASSRRLMFAEPEADSAPDIDAERRRARTRSATGAPGASPADRLRAAAVLAATARAVPVRVLSRAVAAYLTLAREIGATPDARPAHEWRRRPLPCREGADADSRGHRRAHACAPATRTGTSDAARCSRPTRCRCSSSCSAAATPHRGRRRRCPRRIRITS